MRVLEKRYDIFINTGIGLTYSEEVILPKEAKKLIGISSVLIAKNPEINDTILIPGQTVVIPENQFTNLDCINKTLFLFGNRLYPCLHFNGMSGVLNVVINNKEIQNIPIEDKMYFFNILDKKIVSTPEAIKRFNERKEFINFKFVGGAAIIPTRIEAFFKNEFVLNTALINHYLKINYISNLNFGTFILLNTTNNNFLKINLKQYQLSIYFKYLV